MGSHIAYISTGSNIGEKCRNCRQGIDALTKGGRSFLRDLSLFYATEPVDYKDQDWFINIVVKIETFFDVFELLEQLKKIESNAGRVGSEKRFGPRILDMDIVFYDELVIKSPRLVVPHPRMHKRRFVLKPICDIDPTIVHPVLQKNMKYLLAKLGDEGQRIVQYRCDY